MGKEQKKHTTAIHEWDGDQMGSRQKKWNEAEDGERTKSEKKFITETEPSGG